MPPTWPYPRWIAHRGAGPLAPENTLAAFRAGAARGYRMFECDVQLSSDGVAFLLHDPTLERTTNGRGPAALRPWKELQALDAGGWHSPAHAGERMPSLAQVARWCQAEGAMLDLEIKAPPGTAYAVGRAIGAAAGELWEAGRQAPLVTSFSREALEGARAGSPSLARGLLLDSLEEGWLRGALALDCVAIIAHRDLWTAALRMEIHRAGLRALAFTVNEAAEAQRLLDIGLDGLITDRVDLFTPD